MKRFILGATILCAAGFLRAGTSEVIDHQTVEADSWSRTLGSLSNLQILDSTIHATDDFTIIDSTGVRHALLTVGITNATLMSDGVQTAEGTPFFTIAGKAYSGNTVDVSVVNSTIDARKTTLSLGQTSAPSDVWREYQSYYFTNTTLNLSQLQTCGAMDALFDDCTLNFVNGRDVFGGVGMGGSYAGLKVLVRNSTVKNWPLVLGAFSFAGGNPGEVVISGGTATFSKIAFSNRAAGKLTLTDGADVLLDNEDVAGVNRLEFPNAATPGVAELHITGGAKLNFVSPTASPAVYFGYKNAPNSTVLRIDNGGVWDDSGEGVAALNVYISRQNSSADAYVGEGGTFRVYRLRLGSGGDASVSNHACVHQTGGLVRVCRGGVDNEYGFVELATDGVKNKECCYYLNGGVLKTPRIYGGSTAYFKDPTANNKAILSANGGTLQPGYDSTTYEIVSDLDRAECGPKGLTVDANYSSGVVINQEFTNIEGTEGLFRKVGAYPLTLQFPGRSDWDVTETRVEEGELVIGGDGKTMATTLVVTNGATLSLAGEATTLTVDNLVVNGGTLKLDAGDQIVVTGAAEIRDVTLAFATAPTEPVTNEILSVAEPLTEASVGALRSAAAALALPSGLMGRAVVETSGGKTTVKVVVRGEAEPLTETTMWTGWSSDLWNDAENGWTDGVPTADKKAVFASEGSREVTVPEGAKAGALEFADGYVLSGETLAMPSARGALTIETTAGETEIAAPLDFNDEAMVTTAAGTSLTLSGDVTHGGIMKDGAGKLVLAGANQFEYGLDFGEGTTVIADKDALGVAQGSAVHEIALANDVLRFNTPDGSEIVTKRGICVTTPEQYQSAVICVDTPATIGRLSSTQGAIIKRGIEPLTVEVADDYTLIAKAASKSAYCQKFIYSFPGEDGSTPTNPGTAANDFFLSLSVAEGELKFRSAPGVTLPTVTANADITVGIHTTNVTKRAVFTLDGVRFLADNKDFYGNGYNDGNNTVTDPRYPLDPSTTDRLRNEVRLVNGAVLHVKNFYGNNMGSGQYMRPSVYMTNAILRAEATHWFSHTTSGKTSVHLDVKSTYRVADSALEGALALGGGVDGDFVNTYLGPVDHTAYGTLELSKTGFGTLLFRDGSVFRVGTFKLDALENRYTLTLAFDGAEWQYGAGDYTFNPALPTTGMDEFFVFEARGKGLILKPEAGTTFTAAYPIGGEGGVVVDGPGTVKFNANTLKFTGAAEVRQGTLDAGGQPVAIRLQPGEAVPTLKDCAPKGRIHVDMGGASCEKGATFAVARISGSTPMNFKAVNFADPDLYGYFTVRDGLVTMTVGDKPGIMIIVR